MTRWGRRLLVEPRRPAAVRRLPRSYWLVVGTVCVGAFMGQLDASIVTLAFPTLQADFHASLTAVEWVALSYLLVLVATVTAVGRLADSVGRKLLYTYGFGLFTLASVACGLAPNLLALDAFRAVQALGAALLQANSVALITAAMPAGMLGRGIGVQGAAQAVGLALGPTVGGLLIAVGGWRLIFYANVPAGVIGMVLAWFLLPRSRGLAPRTPFDWSGLALLVPAVCALLLALSLGTDAQLGSAAITGLVLLAAGCVALLVRHLRKARFPLVDPRLFGKPQFSAGIGAGLLSYLVLFGVLFVMPFLLEVSRGHSPRSAGLELAALPVALGLVAPFAGRLADRLGARLPTVAGMLITAGSLAVLAAHHSDTAVIVVALAVTGVGLGLFTPANNAAIMGSAPRERHGTAGGVLNMTRGIGTSLGVAATGFVFGAAAGRLPAQRLTGTSVGHGFTVAALFLSGVAGLAALLGLLAGRAPADD